MDRSNLAASLRASMGALERWSMDLGHDLDQWVQIENGWQAVCKDCQATAWLGKNGEMFSPPESACPLQAERRHADEYWGPVLPPVPKILGPKFLKSLWLRLWTSLTIPKDQQTLNWAIYLDQHNIIIWAVGSIILIIALIFARLGYVNQYSGRFVPEQHIADFYANVLID